MAKIRTLTANPAGLAKWLERESQTMHPLQFFREAVQNEIEAGADKIIIDGFRGPNGHLLARLSGNGTGMSRAKLISHLATVMTTDKGDATTGSARGSRRCRQIRLVSPLPQGRPRKRVRSR